ncbi:nucleotidyltransferase domain-containing protein [Actinopolymorpha pittospori]
MVNDAAQLSLIEHARVTLEEDPRILAAWLAGSYARDEADAYSDVDLHCLIDDDDADWFTEHWTETADRIVPAVAQRSIPGLIGGFVISAEWLHVDLLFYRRSAFDPARCVECAPLFDRTGTLVPAAGEAGQGVTADISRRTFEFFLYIIGNLVVTLRRGEHLVALSGVTTVRDDFLIPLMLAESGTSRRGGAKRLNLYLTAEQREFLASLPAAAADPESILTAIAPMAAEYLWRGRVYAETHGIAWPERFEEATVDHLHRHLGLDIRAGVVTCRGSEDVG